MNKTFEHFLKLIQESVIDLYSFKPGSTFKFLVPSEAKDGMNNRIEVSPRFLYTVVSIDEDNALVNAIDQVGTEVQFDIDSIFDNVQFLTNGDVNESKRSKWAFKEGDKAKFNKKDISYSEFEDVEISKEEIKSIENLICTITSLDMDNSDPNDTIENKKDYQYFSIKFDNGVKLDAISGYHLTPIKVNENTSIYKISGTKDNKSQKTSLSTKKCLQFETSNPIDALKKAKGLGLSAIETPDGIEINIKDTNSKELAITFLQANGYGEKDGYDIKSLKKMFPILETHTHTHTHT